MSNEINAKLTLIEEELKSLKEKNKMFKIYLITSIVLTFIVCWASYIVKVID